MFYTKSPGIGGRLRQRIEDFKVEELTPTETLHETLQAKRYGKEVGHEKHTVFWLEKFNWDTNQAIKEIARELHISVSRIGIAGTKDKRAVTKQRVSVYGVAPHDFDKVHVEGLRLYDFEESDRKIQLGESGGNRFIITIRGIELSKDELDGRLKEIISELRNGIPNVFGPQRFGEVRALTHLVGFEMLKSKFEQACKIYLALAFKDEPEEAVKARKVLWQSWGTKTAYSKALNMFPMRLRYERAMLDYLQQHPRDFGGVIRRLPKRLRKMFINAVQSWIWNETLEECIKKKIDLNGLKIPLVGYDTKLNPKDKLHEIIVDKMKQSKLSAQNFRMKGMPEMATSGGEREALLFPKTLAVNDISDDELNQGKTKATISFDLRSGSYATVVLKEVMKPTESAAGDSP